MSHYPSYFGGFSLLGQKSRTQTRPSYNSQLLATHVRVVVPGLFGVGVCENWGSMAHGISYRRTTAPSTSMTQAR